MTTVSTLAQSLSAHPGPWNGGHGWFPFFGFFIVANVLARRFAAGEIDEEEDEQRISTLRRLGHGRGRSSAIGRVGEATGPCPPSRRD